MTPEQLADTSLAAMADAAFAANIPPGFPIAAGYYGGPGAYHVWAPGDWRRFPGDKLPIWVAATGSKDGFVDGNQAVKALMDLGVPAGCITALDMETMKDDTYAARFGAVLGSSGYKTWVYGSLSTVKLNPQLNGYWIADYTGDQQVVKNLLAHAGTRAVQDMANRPPGYDVSAVKPWTEGEMWHG